MSYDNSSAQAMSFEGKPVSAVAADGPVRGRRLALVHDDAIPLALAIVDLVARLGVCPCFGVTGGPIAPVIHALEDDERVRFVMTRSEPGAVLAALGAWFACGRPAAVTTTGGPGMLSTRAPLETVKAERGQLVLFSPATPAHRRGRHAAQGSDSFPSADFLVPGHLFDVVVQLESPEQLGPLAVALTAGLARPDGFLAHVVIPANLLRAAVKRPPLPDVRAGRLTPDPTVVNEVARLLRAHPFFVIAGRGARRCAPLVRRLTEATGAPAVITPGAMGTLAGATNVGVCGIGGDDGVVARIAETRPELALVLGSRLSDASVPDELLSLVGRAIQVDRDLEAMGTAPVPTTCIQSDLEAFLSALLEEPEGLVHRPPVARPWVRPGAPEAPPPPERVRPRALMHHLQEIVVDGSDALLFVDVGSPWPWTTSLLDVADPDRFSLETAVGSMGRGFAAAIGAAATGRKAVAISGDWSIATLLGEIGTAVDACLPVVVVAVNSAGGQMVLDGDRAVWGRATSTAKFRLVDLAAVAKAHGAGSARVTREHELAAALRRAMASPGPFLVDVVVDTTETPPYARRFEELGRQMGVRRGS